VVSSNNSSYPSGYVVIGTNSLYQQPQNQQPTYWFVVIDATNLNVVYNQLWQANDQVPPISQYETPNYILVVVSLCVGLDSQPQGALYDFLVANGAATGLATINQVAQQVGCGALGQFAYSLVSPLGGTGDPGFESYNLGGSGYSSVQALQLQPVAQPGGGVIYVPVQLGDA
jgi:hypothetical protein